MNIICPKCGTPFDGRYRICPVCGTDTATYTNPGGTAPNHPARNTGDQQQGQAYDNNTSKQVQQPDTQGQPRQPYYNNQWQPQQPYHNNQGQSQQPYYNNQGQPQQPYHNNQGQPQQPYYNNQGQSQQPYHNNQGQPQQPYFNNQGQPQQPYYNNQGQPQQPYHNNQGQSQQPYHNNQGQPQQSYYDQDQPQQPYYNEYEPQQPSYAQPKAKKKHKLPWILRFLIANLIIAIILLGAWFGFGNIITLNIHADTVVETLNSGSLDLPGMNNAYSELPDYVKGMLGNEERYSGEYGPMTKAILPYISAEKVKVHGFFGGSSVEYSISAPDIESWLLGLDPSRITSADALLAMMEEYMQSAPYRSVNVTVEYSRSGFFSADWHGNYYTREFSDAVCGGFNSAYNELYSKVYDEIMGTIHGAQEEKK